LVGMAGFEPTTTCPPDKCATKLRYIPTTGVILGKGIYLINKLRPKTVENHTLRVLINK
jgi:hypothetical protein